MRNIEEFMTAAGGRIRCRRCTALSTRTHEQCRKPAVKSSKGQKCRTHGAASTGPRTPEGKARIAAAHFKHGRDTNAARAASALAAAKLSQLEDVLVLLKLIDHRAPGRKAAGYVPITSLDQALQMAIDDVLNCVEGHG